ncbi:MAG: hypothetical protein IPH04_02740 [Saprospirales bacterium]|nr:hypothetical protein [Saprospirales bacterium]
MFFLFLFSSHSKFMTNRLVVMPPPQNMFHFCFGSSRRHRYIVSTPPHQLSNRFIGAPSIAVVVDQDGQVEIRGRRLHRPSPLVFDDRADA